MNPTIRRLNGIVTVLNTPFTAEDHIDLDSLSSLDSLFLRWQVKSAS